MKLNFDLNTDERGVSPVIGVILMVAITVILAAVIGAFVLNLGSNLGSTGPNTQLSASDASDDYSGSTADILQISHKGGDEIKASDIKIVVTPSEGSAITLDPAYVNDATGLQAYEQLDQGTDVTSDASLSVGGSWYLNGAGGDINSGETVTVQVIHKPSQSILLDTEVTVQ